MTRRRYRSTPQVLLETMLKMRVLRWSHIEVRAELMTRQVAKDIAASSNESGPWPCVPPEGMC